MHAHSGARVGGVFDEIGDFFGDFSKSTFGQLVLTYLSSGLYSNLLTLTYTGPPAAIMQTFGPQLATAVYALPGVARGDPFVASWIEGLAPRLVGAGTAVAGPIVAAKVAAYKAALGDAARQMTEPAYNELVNRYAQAEFKKIVNAEIKSFTTDLERAVSNAEVARGIRGAADNASVGDARRALERAGLDPVTLSRRLNIRPDAAAGAINLLAKKNIYRLGTPVDPETEFDGQGRPNARYGQHGPPAPLEVITVENSGAFGGDYVEGSPALTAALDSILATVRAVAPTLEGSGGPLQRILQREANNARIGGQVRNDNDWMGRAAKLLKDRRQASAATALLNVRAMMPERAGGTGGTVSGLTFATPMPMRSVEPTRPASPVVGWLTQLYLATLLTAPAWGTWLVLRSRSHRQRRKGRERS